MSVYQESHSLSHVKLSVIPATSGTTMTHHCMGKNLQICTFPRSQKQHLEPTSAAWLTVVIRSSPGQWEWCQDSLTLKVCDRQTDKYVYIVFLLLSDSMHGISSTQSHQTQGEWMRPMLLHLWENSFVCTLFPAEFEFKTASGEYYGKYEML